MHKAVHHTPPIRGVELVALHSDQSFPRHSHDEFGIGYMVDGGQESWSGRGAVEARRGDVITVNPGELHDGIGHTDCPRRWYMLYLTPAFVDVHTDQRIDAFEFQDPVVRSDVSRRQVQQLFETLANSTDEDDAGAEEQIRMVLAGLGGRRDSSAPLPSKGIALSAPTARVLERIHDEWMQPLSLADFAQSAALSRFATLRLFAAEIGVTPYAYLTQHRVKRARQLIVTGLPLSEAAQLAGFSDQSHMTRAFKRQFGSTPGQLLTRRCHSERAISFKIKPELRVTK